MSDGRDLLTSYFGPEELRVALEQNQAEPLSLASADFDEDGVPDLVSGYSFNGQGIVTLLRGNVDSIYPKAPEAQERKASGTFTNAPFLSPAHVFSVPVAADFIGAGDFDADGHWDLVAAGRESTSLALLVGDGRGGLRPAREIGLPGAVTALVAGDINRRDGLTDLVVGVEDAGRAQLLVFESPKGVMRSEPEVFDLPAPVSALALGFLNQHYAVDLAIAAGRELLVMSGRDRRLSLREVVPVDVEPVTFERYAFDSPIRSIAVGDFVGDSQSDIALLTEDGAPHVLGQSDVPARARNGAKRWVRSTLSDTRWPDASRLVVAGVSGLPKDDLLLLDSTGRRLDMLAHGTAQQRPGGVERVVAALDVAATMEVEGAPLAVLPMRLDIDGLTDLAILRDGTTAPTIALTADGSRAKMSPPPQQLVTSFSNPSPITINGTNVSPYPSTINVSGMAGPVDKLRVRFTNLSLNTFRLSVLDILLVGPAGQKLALMSDVSTCCSPTNVTFSFDDDASAFLTDQSISGTYKPTDVNDGSDTFPAPAPAAPYAATLSAFNGTNPNGTWSLFVRDDESSWTGSIADGWTLYLGPDGPPPARVVTNTNDSGPGSLRQAMLDTNATFGPEIISFNIGSGPQTILPTSPLPIITETVTIDATTQPGFAGQPIIELNMSQAGLVEAVFNIRADRTVIRGFVINRYENGNSFSGGVFIRTGENNIVEGNYIGTNLGGTADADNSTRGAGIATLSRNNLFGGTTVAARNVLAGLSYGILIGGFSNTTASSNTVQGNFIGTNASGAAAIQNLEGIDVWDSPNNVFGGTTSGARNLISGSIFSGIDFSYTRTTGNLVQGNFIGTDVNGVGAINNNDGVSITTGPSSNTVGGTAVTARNLISGNAQGVGIGTSGQGGSTPNNTVQGNFIGTDATGTAPLANGTAVTVPANVVGSQVSTNRIAFNRRDGVEIQESSFGNDAPGIRVAIFENEIYANGSSTNDLGIDLGPTGITPNDAGDPDGGANLRQNFPVLTSASFPIVQGERAPGDKPEVTVNVNGTLNSAPNTTFTVHWYFSSDAQCVTNQQTSRPLVTGKVPNVMTNASGDAQFNFPLDFPVGINNGIVNCTSTDPQGNTSEFSACLVVNAAPPKTLKLSASSYTAGEAVGSMTVTVQRTGDTAGAASVNYTTSDTAGSSNCNVVNTGKASSRCDYLTTVGALSFAVGETAKTISIPIIDDAYAEGGESFTVTLSNATGATLGSPGSAPVSITDNETTNGANPINQARYYVRVHYLDFLNREPDTPGWDFWTNQITVCGSDVGCNEVRRVDVSASFFLSIEFQQTGYLVERTYKAAYGDATGNSTFGGAHTLTVPVIRFDEFLTDTQQITRGVVVLQPGWEQLLESNKVAFFNEFVQRTRFTAAGAFPSSLSAAAFVDQLNTRAGNPLSAAERNQLVSDLTASTKTRAQVLRAVAEHQNLVSAEYNRAFVLMQYFGYLHRNPNDPQDSDYTGYDFWLVKLNQFSGNYNSAEMVKAFITSIEYGRRFGP